MKRIVLATLGIVGSMIIAMPHVQAQMPSKMDKNMEGHISEMQGKSDGKKADTVSAQEQVAEAAGVTVKAAYTNPGEKNPVFKVVLDTHSADLDSYAFKDIVLLRFPGGKGKSFGPTIVSESGSGHHREAVVEFKDADLTEATAMEVVVKKVAGVEERILRFDLLKGKKQ